LGFLNCFLFVNFRQETEEMDAAPAREVFSSMPANPNLAAMVVKGGER